MNWRPVPQALPTEVTALGFALDGIVPEDDDLSEAERLRAGEQATPVLTARYRAAHAVLRAALGRCIGVAPGRLHLVVGPHGKPWLPDHPQWHFNLSHCDAQALIAIGPGPLGVDLEAQAPRRGGNEGLARRVLDDASLRPWLAQSTNARAELLCRALTVKEAYFKALGTGLGHVPMAVVLPPASGEGPMVSGPDGDATWWVRPLSAPAGYCASLCTQGTPPPVSCYRLETAGWAAIPDRAGA